MQQSPAVAVAITFMVLIAVEKLLTTSSKRGGMLRSARDRTDDLLDANESTWEFVAVCTVGGVENLLVRALSALA
jgi:hypothetical protein